MTQLSGICLGSHHRLRLDTGNNGSLHRIGLTFAPRKLRCSRTDSLVSRRSSKNTAAFFRSRSLQPPNGVQKNRHPHKHQGRREEGPTRWQRSCTVLKSQSVTFISTSRMVGYAHEYRFNPAMSSFSRKYSATPLRPHAPATILLLPTSSNSQKLASYEALLFLQMEFGVFMTGIYVLHRDRRERVRTRDQPSMTPSVGLLLTSP